MGIWEWFGRRVKLTEGTFWSEFYGRETYAGKTVTIDSALQLSTAWSCIRLLAETVGTMPLGMFERDRETNERRPAGSHPLQTVLHDIPNPDQTACEFWEGIIAWLCAWGNAYAEKFFNNKGEVDTLRILRADQMVVGRDGRNRLAYEFNEGGGQKREIPANRVFHVRGFGFGGDLGLSPIGYARQSLASALATEETTGKIFSNALTVAGILKSDQVLNADQRAQLADLLKAYTSSTNAQKTLVLEAGLEWKQVTMNPEDAQMLETRGFQVEEICRWFRVPPFMIGHTEKSTSWGTGLEQQQIGFLQFALAPYLERIEQAIQRQLIPVTDRGRFFAEFNIEGLLRADSAARASFHSTALQNGWMSRNEVRAKENFPPIEGGNEYTVQSNLMRLADLGSDTNQSQQVRTMLRAWLTEETKHDKANAA